MPTPLLPWGPPSVSRLVIAWLMPLGGAGSCGAQRPQSATTPYRMVTVTAGTENAQKLMQSATVSVHTFAPNMDIAEYEAGLTHQRMLLMGPPLAAPQSITYVTPGGSVTAVPHSVCTKAIPTYLSYEDELIYRFFARYEVQVRFQ